MADGPKPKRATKRQVRARVKHWQRALDLEGWDCHLHFGANEEQDEAECHAKPEYETMHLRFDLTQITADEVEDYAVHEVAHGLVEPLAHCALTLAGGDARLQEWVRTQEEALTTRLQKIFRKLTEI